MLKVKKPKTNILISGNYIKKIINHSTNIYTNNLNHYKNTLLIKYLLNNNFFTLIISKIRVLN